MKTLVTGGMRSGKSAHAERLITASSVMGAVTYVGAGAAAEGDAEWAERVAAHRRRRPATWLTIETIDLPEALLKVEEPALVDSLGTWLTAQFDDLDAWNAPVEQWRPVWEARSESAVEALREHDHDLVIVTEEVGLCLVPDNRAGRIFTDALGSLNQAVAQACDRVDLIVAGQALTITDRSGS